MPTSRGHRWLVRVGLAYAAAATLLLPDARAAERATVRVLVSTPRGADTIIGDAVVLAQGELSAVGLVAEVQAAAAAPQAGTIPGDVYGVLELSQRGPRLLIRARAPRSPHAIEATVDLGAAGVTAEVIAVRAVETLRAAMLQFAQGEGGNVPQAVRGFTRFESEEAPAPSEPLERLVAPLAFWLGPSLSFHAGVAPDLGAQAGVLVGPSFGFAAAAVETTGRELRLSAAHGSATVSRRALWAQLGARFRASPSWEITTRAGAGYASFEVAGNADPGYSAERKQHGSLSLMLGVSGAYWATRGLGVYGSVGFRLATDAPTIRIADKIVTTLDRPAFVASLGTTLGVF